MITAVDGPEIVLNKSPLRFDGQRAADLVERFSPITDDG